MSTFNIRSISRTRIVVKPEQVPRVAAFALTAEQVQRLDEASAVPPPYPYDFIASASQRR